MLPYSFIMDCPLIKTISHYHLSISRKMSLKSQPVVAKAAALASGIPKREIQSHLFQELTADFRETPFFM